MLSTPTFRRKKITHEEGLWVCSAIRVGAYRISPKLVFPSKLLRISDPDFHIGFMLSHEYHTDCKLLQDEAYLSQHLPHPSPSLAIMVNGNVPKTIIHFFFHFGIFQSALLLFPCLSKQALNGNKTQPLRLICLLCIGFHGIHGKVDPNK